MAENLSLKAELFRAIVTRSDNLEKLLTNDLSRDFISVKHAEECLFCRNDIERTVIDMSQAGCESMVVYLVNMVEMGKCYCIMDSDTSSVGVSHGVSLLHLACVYGPLTLVERLIRDGHDVNATSLFMQYTPLHMTAHSVMPSEELVRVTESLLEAGAVTTHKEKRENTALHMSLRGRTEVAPVILSAILNGPTSLEALNMENVTGETALLVATKAANCEMVHKLAEAGADVNVKDQDELLALSIAIHKDSMAMLRSLLASPTCNTGLVGVARLGQRPMCPLVYATCRENVQAVELLLKAGAFVDCVDHEDSQPLLIAAYTDNLLIGKMLIDGGADVNLAPRQGYTALHHSAWEGHVDMCRLLLDAGSSHDTQTEDRNTPLALACHGDSLETIRLLLTRGCRVNNQDKDLDAPLHYCAYNARYEGVRLLINYGANPDLENSFHVTPLWNAVFAGDLSSAELLIQCNVRLSVASVGIDQHAQTDDPTVIYDTPRTPLYVACAKGHRDLAFVLMMAGVEIKEEPWYWGADFPQALRAEGVLLHWLTQQATQPRSLLRISRNVIRRMLGLQPHKKVDRLELPTILKNFVLIKSFDMDL